MSRSFIAGSVSGLALSVLGLSAVSLMAPPVSVAPAIPAPAPAPGVAAGDAAGAAVVAQGDADQTAPQTAPAGSEFNRPKPDAEAAVPVADAPAATAPAAPAATPPDAAESQPAVVTEATAPPATADGAPQPLTPAPAEGGAAADTTQVAVAEPPPAPPAAPAAPALPTPAPEGTAPADVATAPATDSAAPAPDTTETNVAPPQPQTLPEDQPAPADAIVPEPQTEPAATAPDAAPVRPRILPVPGAEVVPDGQVALPDDGGDESIPAPDEGEAPSTGSLLPEAGKPKILRVTPRPSDSADQPAGGASAAAPNTEVATTTMPGARVNRLPTIGDSPTAEQAAPSSAGEIGTAPVQPEAEGPLAKYAAKFANPENKPVLAVVILDKGVEAGGMDPSALSALPYPVTIAVDPMRADAAATAATYRAAGDEVAMLVGDPPQGATPADQEVAYQSYTQALPESVALIVQPGAELLRNSMASQHLAAMLKADGRGLVTYEQGLNAGRRAAEKIGLAQVSVEKVFGQGEDNSGTMARELDRMAFQADQRRVAVIAIPSTPDAITAFVAWATGPTAAAVAIAPVSAVMPAHMPN